MLFSTLTDIADNMRLPERDRAMAKLLIEACNDWPEFDLKDPHALVSTLKMESSQPLTLANLMLYNARHSPAHDAWKMESMASIIAFMQRSINSGLPDNSPLDDAIKHFGKRCGYG